MKIENCYFKHYVCKLKIIASNTNTKSRIKNIFKLIYIFKYQIRLNNYHTFYKTR